MSPVTLWQKLTAACIFLLGIGIWISTQILLRGATGGRIYSILLDESVSGLAPSSLVRYNGIEVGKVVKIRNDFESNQVCVDILIFSPQVRIYGDKKDPDNPHIILKRGTRAILTGNLVTGIKYIELTGGGAGCPLLKGKFIPAGKSNFAALASQLDDFVLEARQLFTAENRENIRQTLANLRKISAHLERILSENPGQASTINRLNQVLDNAQILTGPQTLRRLHRILDHAADLTDPAHLKIDQLVRDVHLRVVKLLDQAQTLLHNLNTIIDSHQRQADLASLIRELYQLVKENRPLIRQALEKVNLVFADMRTLLHVGQQKLVRILETATSSVVALRYVLNRELPGALRKFNEAMRDLSDVLRLLKSKPDALIWGSNVKGK